MPRGRESLICSQADTLKKKEAGWVHERVKLAAEEFHNQTNGKPEVLRNNDDE